MSNGVMTLPRSSSVYSYWIDLVTSYQTRYGGCPSSCHSVTHHDPQVVAPVRETVSQTLASLLLHMPKRSVTHVHSILLQMIRQDFAVPSKASGSKQETEKSHVWEVRHAGLLGVKYEVAVRTDLFETDTVKKEEDDMGEVGKDVLRGVVDAAVLGYVQLRS